LTGPARAWTRSACAPDGGELTGPNPTDRGKPGSKYYLLVDRRGIPLAVCLSAANTHDSMLLEPLVDAVPPVKGRPAKLHGDNGYDTRAADVRCADAGSRPGSPDVGSSPVTSWAGTARWWSGRWPG
jgi:Transposase DDE domain